MMMQPLIAIRLKHGENEEILHARCTTIVAVFSPILAASSPFLKLSLRSEESLLNSLHESLLLFKDVFGNPLPLIKDIDKHK